ncbi:transposase family protein [Streptomyces gilvus]|uniref:transposase family protein n=1 Tax=Streptomyces gilvus TaxID=2920937 RepID=UPI001F0FD58B|nr:transposase family protein [Streptomyces sp. CME 23]MCH5677607.1 transposase family protein [Streptomyces sp. CME 23]
MELVERAATGVVTMHARARSEGADCPHCGSASGRVHGRCMRRLADAGVGGASVVIELLVRRFTCLAQLHQEIVALGFAGRIQTVQRYLRLLKAATAAPPVRGPAPRPRRIVRWIMTDPGNLTDEAADLKEIRTSCPELDAVTHHVRDFTAMMRDLTGDQLPAWMDRILADDLPALHSLVNGLSRDIDAATAGLSTPWSSGHASQDRRQSRIT